MARGLTFKGDYPWGARPHGKGNRPYSQVVLKAARAGWSDVPILCIVDSGADELQIDEGWLRRAGYGFANIIGSRTVTNAGLSTVKLDEYIGIVMEIEGSLVTVPIVLAASGVADLLGRNGFLTAIHAAFDNKGWLYG